MSTPRRWVPRPTAALNACLAGVIAFAGLALLAPAAQAGQGAAAPAPTADHTVVFGSPTATSSDPRDLVVASGDIVFFENGSLLPNLTRVRVTVGPDTLVLGADPVPWKADHSTGYQVVSPLLAGAAHTITVTPPPPAPPDGSLPGGGPVPPPPGAGSTGAAPPPARTAAPARAVVPGHPAGDPGHVPSAGAVNMKAVDVKAAHRADPPDSISEVIAAPRGVAAAPRTHAHQAAMIPGRAPRPLQLALGVLAGLLLLVVGGALSRAMFRAWLDAAPTPV